VFVCFCVFMYLNMDTFNQAQRKAELGNFDGPATKTIVLIRHGQAEHNVNEDYTIFDPALTKLGVQQSKDLSVKFSSINIDLIVVSPLRRTVQTAANIFSSEKYNSVSIIANELCRESYGLVVCDKRSNLTAIKEEFASSKVDFSLIATEEDTWWESDKEPPEHLEQRVREFYRFLKSRPESNIAVVTHHGFLKKFFAFLRTSPVSGAHIYTTDEFLNCESRIVSI